MWDKLLEGISVSCRQEVKRVSKQGDHMFLFVSDGYTFFITGDFGKVKVSEEDANLVIDALKSQAGELTAADFHPNRVKEILERVRQNRAP